MAESDSDPSETLSDIRNPSSASRPVPANDSSDAEVRLAGEGPDGDGFDSGLSGSGIPGSAASVLKVDIEGFEGPLDVLLLLARSQKVDLKKIAIVSLVDQYMAFVAEAKRMNLELAADYLVMAAWLTYLKSKLLLPRAEGDGDEPSGEEMAARLQFRLQKLQAMREAGARLMARDRLGRDVFARGNPEIVRIVRTPKYETTLYDLLKAYTQQRVRDISHDDYKIERPPVLAIEMARKRLERLFGRLHDWHALDALLPTDWQAIAESPDRRRIRRRSTTASTFLASLELTKEGKMELRQLTAFGPIYVRSVRAGADYNSNE